MVHVKMRIVSIGNNIINKANHVKNKVKEESIHMMSFGQIFLGLGIDKGGLHFSANERPQFKHYKRARVEATKGRGKKNERSRSNSVEEEVLSLSFSFLYYFV